MKIIHIYQKSSKIFMEPYIQFIKDMYTLENHFFIVWDRDSKGCDETKENFLLTDSMNTEEVRQLLRIGDKIILHSLFIPKVVAYFSIHPYLLKKTYWISWGGDIEPFTEQRKDLKAYLYESMRRFVIKRFAGIGTLVNADFKKICEKYFVRGKHYRAIYLNQLLVNESKLYFNADVESNEEKCILLGNSATESNRHIEALEFLEKFKHKPLKIICPLSYGNMEYRELVKKKGKELFGDKFCPLEEFLNEKAYYRLLGTVDAGIFNNDRQQALGNIYALLIQGKKLYLRKGTPMWDELVEEDKVKIYNVEHLKNMEFVELDEMPDETRKSNSELILYKNSPENSKKIWDLIFEE